MIGFREMGLTTFDLMELHVKALFTHDANNRMHGINEPWPGERPAPRFFLGRTAEGHAICRFRHDVPKQLALQLEQLCGEETFVKDYHTKPKHFENYMNLLQGERYTMGPCFLVPELVVSSNALVSLTRENLDEWLHGGFEWLVDEIDFVQPCIALVQDGRAVSICRSVRVTPKAHEAGLETLEAFRGKGYAADVVAGWAAAVRKMGCIPLYSTLSDNVSSQRVAAKAPLSFYGVNFTVL